MDLASEVVELIRTFLYSVKGSWCGISTEIGA